MIYGPIFIMNMKRSNPNRFDKWKYLLAEWVDDSESDWQEMENYLLQDEAAWKEEIQPFYFTNGYAARSSSISGRFCIAHRLQKPSVFEL